MEEQTIPPNTPIGLGTVKRNTKILFVASKVERISHHPTGQVYSFCKSWKLKMVTITQLPGEPKKLAFKKNDPNLIRCVSPVCCVNYPPKKPAGKKLSFVKITFSKSATKNFEIFITGNMEAAIKLVMVHETILTDLKLDDQIKVTQALITAKKKTCGPTKAPGSSIQGGQGRPVGGHQGIGRESC